MPELHDITGTVTRLRAERSDYVTYKSVYSFISTHFTLEITRRKATLNHTI